MIRVTNSYDPGSPDWWVYRLGWSILDQQARYDKLEMYHIGEHPLPPVDRQYLKAMRQYQRMAQTNYVALVNEGSPGRMKVKGFKFGQGGVDDDAKMIWAANDMDLQSKKLHMAAAVFGDEYALVGEVDEGTGYPTITVLDPRTAAVEGHPVFPTRALAGMHLYIDTYSNSVVGQLYLEDQIYDLEGPNVATMNGWPKAEMTTRLLRIGYPGGLEVVGSRPNPINQVPLVQFRWKPDFGNYSFGEAENILHIQDRINYMILDRLKIARDQAYAQRTVTGLQMPKKGGDPSIGPIPPPFKLDSASLWVAESPDVKFDQFPATDFKQILEAVRDDIADMAAISQTPAHYLMNRMVNVSGDTLTQAESGFASKTKLRMEAMGWGWERVMRLCFLVMGDTQKASNVDASVVWANPMSKKPAEDADAANKWVSVGVPIDLIMDKFGDFEPDEITHAVEEQKKKLAEEKAAADAQLQIQQKVADAKTAAPKTQA